MTHPTILKHRAGYALLLGFALFMLGWLILNGRPYPVPRDEELLPVVDLQYALYPQFVIDPLQIIGIEFTVVETGEQVAIVVEDDLYTWRFRDQTEIIDPALGDGARLALALMPSLDTIIRGETDPAAFGFLPNPQYVVRFQLDDLNVGVLLIGDRTPSGSDYYVAPTPDSPIVNVVPAYWLDRFVALMGQFLPLNPDGGETPIP